MQTRELDKLRKNQNLSTTLVQTRHNRRLALPFQSSLQASVDLVNKKKLSLIKEKVPLILKSIDANSAKAGTLLFKNARIKANLSSERQKDIGKRESTD